MFAMQEIKVAEDSVDCSPSHHVIINTERFKLRRHSSKSVGRAYGGKWPGFPTPARAY